MATQIKLSGTLPTPAQARTRLAEARETYRLKSKIFAGFKDRVEAAKEEIAAANVDIDSAEEDLLASVVDSPEDVDASARHESALKRSDRARRDLEKVEAARRLASREMVAAFSVLTSARGDISAIRQGRRRAS